MFGCVQKGCGHDLECWKAFRLQLPSTISQEASLCSGNSEEKLDEPFTFQQNKNDPIFSLEGLKQAIESTSKKNPKQRISPKRSQMERKGIRIEGGIQLPEFWIEAEAESFSSEVTPSHETSHIQEALERYSKTKASDDNEWMDEVYEKSDLPFTNSTSFLRFQTRLQTFPEQCVRYGFNGSHLNPSSSSIQPSACSCGSPRVFEMQLMPYLIHALQEAAEWLSSEEANGIQRRYAMNAFLEWDWTTMSVFTCSQSCEIGHLGLVDEYIWKY